MSNFIAIDLDSQGLYAADGTVRGGVRVAHALAWTGDDGEPPPPLTADTAKAVGEKLRDKFRVAGVKPAPVFVVVGRDRVILKELKYPAVAPAEEPALIRFQAMKEMSESPDEVVLDYAPLGEAGGERRAMVVVVRKEQLAAAQALCQGLGLKLAGVTPRPYAVAAGLLRAFAANAVTPPDAAGDAVAALTVGPAGGEFTVVRGGAVTFTLAIPAPVVANEAMFAGQIRRNLTVYAGQHPGHPIAAVYVAEVDGPWVPRLRAALTVPVREYDPLGESAPEIPDHLRGRFAGAVGLLAGRGADTLPINFAAPRQPQTEKDPAKRKLAFVALAAALLLLVGGVGGSLFVSAREEQVNELVKRRDALKEAVDKGKPDVTKWKAVDGWAKREVVWLDELYDLAARMPDNDSVRVLQIRAVPIPPGKDGKQASHSQVELKLAATNAGAVAELQSGFTRDNPPVSKDQPNPNKYYAGTVHSVGQPIPNAVGGRTVSSTLNTRIAHRDPDEYVRNPKFKPLPKTAGGSGGKSGGGSAGPNE